MASGDHDLTRPAAAAVRCLAVGSKDDVLVLCNADQRAIAEALAEAAERAGRSVRTLEFPSLTRHGEEPPAAVAQAMAHAAVILAATTFSISHTQARLRESSLGARIASLPGITVETFKRALSVDYRELTRTGQRIAGELSAASACHITSPGGTDLVLRLAGRTATCDDGDLHAQGAFGNLPAGEAYIAPHETLGDGTIVFDGTLGGHGALREPLHITLVDGRATDARGDGAQWLLNTLDRAGPTGRMIAELGIGTNPRAILTGNILEDEKVAGTAHLAFGTSASFGGTTVSTVHIDGILLQPTIHLDNRPLLRNGKLLQQQRA